MSSIWWGYAREGDRARVSSALASARPRASISYAHSPSALRARMREEEPRTVGAVVGPCEAGVSDINLAAALVRDGYAREVALVTHDASGSLRSRALSAGITMVLETAAMSEDGLPECLGEVRDGDGFGVAPGLLCADSASHDGDKACVAGLGLSQTRHPSMVPEQAGEVVPTPPRSDLARGPQPREDGMAPVVTVVSGRGGVGKTTLCALMGALAGAWGMAVALVDLDLSCGNLGSCFSISRGPDLAPLSGHLEDGTFADEVGRVGMACTDGVDLWGPVERPEHAETAMPLVGPLLRVLRRSHDLVIVDTSTACTDGVAQAMQESDRLVCVQGRGAGGVASLARMSALAVRLGVARTRIVRVEGMSDPRAWGRPFEPRVEIGLETARAFRVVEGTPDVMELIRSGAATELVALEDDLSRSVATLLGVLLQELGCLPGAQDAQRAAQGAFVRKTFSLFGRRREAV